MADITLTTSASSGTIGARPMRSVVFTTSLIGYVFFVDSNSDFSYLKTTDGGQTWSGLNVVRAGSVLGADVWFDKWTPTGTGTIIHTWYIDANTVFYRSLDTSGDTLGTETTVFAGASAVSGRGVFVSGAKAVGGNLLCAFDIDAGAEHGTYRSTDSGANWGSRTDFVEATVDQLLMFPGNAADPQDMWALYQDASTDELTLKVHDDSANTNSESTAITLVEQVTDGTGQYAFSAAVRHSDGLLVSAFWNAFDSATGDFKCVVWNGTSAPTTKTDIVTDTDDGYYPAVYIDQGTDNIYVAYRGLRDGTEVLGSTTKVYYVKSTDGGTTWSSGNTAMQAGATDAGRQVFAPLSGPRFYPVWKGPTIGTYTGNFSNSVALGVAFDAISNSGYQSPSGSYSWSHTCSGNSRLLAVDVELLSVPGTTVSGIAYNSVAMSFIGAKSTVSGAGRVESWRLVAPSSGSNTIAVTLSASVASSGTAVSYSGVQQSSPTEAYNSSQATNVGSADATVTITSVTNDSWFHAACATDDASITANQTSRNNVTGALGSGANEDTGPLATAGAQAMSYTGVGALATWAIGGYAVRPAYAAGTTTFTAAIAALIGAATSSLAATFAKPTYTAAISASAGHATAALSATFAGTTFTASVAGTTGAVSAALVATFTKPTYTAAIAGSAGHITAALTATFVKPTYTASIGASTGHITAALSATFTKPVYTASIGATAGHVSAALVATFSKPVYTAAIGASTGPTTAALSATFTKPIYTSAISGSVGHVTAALAATFVKPSYTAVISGTVGGAMAALAATFSKPIYTASIAASTGHVSAALSATFTKPSYTAVIGATAGPASASLSATFSKPVYTASIAASTGPATAALSARFTTTYTAAINANVGAATLAASVTFVPVPRTFERITAQGGYACEITQAGGRTHQRISFAPARTCQIGASGGYSSEVKSQAAYSLQISE